MDQLSETGSSRGYGMEAKAVRQSEVQQQMEELSALREELWQAKIALDERLGRVLRGPSDNMIEAKLAEPEVLLCPLADELRSAVKDIRQLRNSIVDITQRIEL